jgi:glycosyltransferase involved in cell wall biosynthesis
VFFGGGVARGGGAELQTALIARGLAREGLRSSIIVWPAEHRQQAIGAGPDVVERPSYAGAGFLGKLQETRHIWSGMGRADAAAYIFRGGGPQLTVAEAFCRLHRRKLVFSAANDLDFDFRRPDRTRTHLTLYRAALRRADLIVAQRREQADLAHAAGLGPVELIPSFAESAEPSLADPEAFLWIGRLVDYKRPMEYVRLAESLPRIRFRMAWFATNETRSELVRELQAAGGRLPNLELIGQVPRGELLELVGRSYAVVSTSRAEGMPNTFLEAWARGVPVISLDFDPDGRIDEKELGLVADSAAGLREAAEALARDPAHRSQLGGRGREYVRERHSPEPVARRWAEVLRGLVQGG